MLMRHTKIFDLDGPNGTERLILTVDVAQFMDSQTYNQTTIVEPTEDCSAEMYVKTLSGRKNEFRKFDSLDTMTAHIAEEWKLLSLLIEDVANLVELTISEPDMVDEYE